MGPVYHALGGDEHDVIVVAHGGDPDDRAVAFAGADVAHAFAAAALFAVTHGRAVFDGLVFRSGLVDHFLSRLFRCLFGIGFHGDLARDIGPERCTFAVAVFADRQQVAVRIRDDHADDFVSLLQVDAAHALGVATHRPGLRFVEANGHAVAGAEHDLVAGLRHDHVDERVAIFEVDANDAAALGPAV